MSDVDKKQDRPVGRQAMMTKAQIVHALAGTAILEENAHDPVEDTDQLITYQLRVYVPAVVASEMYENLSKGSIVKPVDRFIFSVENSQQNIEWSVDSQGVLHVLWSEPHISKFARRSMTFAPDSWSYVEALYTRDEDVDEDEDSNES